MNQSALLLSLIVFFVNNGQCLGQRNYYDLIQHLMQKSPLCTVLLYDLNRMDSNAISANSAVQNPVLIVDGNSSYSKEAMKELVSVRKSRCVLLFAMEYTLNESVIEYLMNETKYRTVYVMSKKEHISTRNKFQPYFLDSVLFIVSITSGNMILSIQVPNITQPIRKMMWLERSNTILPINDDISLGIITDRGTLRQRNVTASGVIFPLFITMSKDKKYVGVEIDILDIVSEKVGFRYKIKPEETWNVRSPITHELDGIVGSIAFGRSQFGLIYSPDIADNDDNARQPIHFSPPTYYSEHNYLVPKAKERKPFSNFVTPFALTVWLCFIASWIAFTFTSYVFNKFHGDSSLSFSRIAMDLFGTVWQQKLKYSLVSPSTGAYSIIFGFWIIGMTFKGAAYCCNLRAFMLMKEYEMPMETDDDIVNRGADLYFPTGAALLDEFQCSKNPAKRELAARAIRRKIIMPLHYNIESVDERMIREGGARLLVRARNQAVLSQFEKYYGYQPLQATKFNTIIRQNCWAMPVNQPWSDEIDRLILQLSAGGIVGQIYRKNVPSNEDAKDLNSRDNLESYKIDHIAGTLTVLAAGLALSFVVACFEVLYYRLECCCIFVDKKEILHGIYIGNT